MTEFTKKEIAFLRRLNTPAKIQDYLNNLKFNFEKKGETIKSPVRVLRDGEAHCFEGAILGAYILSLHGHKPLVLHLETTPDDYHHVIAPFMIEGRWGALSKTNHAVLRYREPVYKDIRELVMSYFHEYFLNDNGKKTLRRYSLPLNLAIFSRREWWIDSKDLWYLDKALDKVPHYDIAPKSVLKNLRRADAIERVAGKHVEYKK